VIRSSQLINHQATGALLSLITTDILTLQEFCDRRKLGRTSVFQRIKDGAYVEGLDYICDGNEKKFYWPCREMIAREQMLRQLGLTTADPVTGQQTEISHETTAPIAPAALLTTGSASNIRPKTHRNKPQTIDSKPSGRRPAFIVRATIQQP